MAFYSKTKTGQNLVFGDNSEINLSTLKHRDIASSISSTEILIKPPVGDSNSGFGGGSGGSPLAIGHSKLVIGSPSNSDISSNNGKVYVYDLSGNLEFTLSPTSGSSNIYFGRSVAIGNGRIAVLSYESSAQKLHVYDLRGNYIGETSSGITQNTAFVAIGSGRIVLSSGGRTPTSGQQPEIYDLDGSLLKTLASGSDYNVGDRMCGPVVIKYGKIIGVEASNSYLHKWNMHDLDGQRVNSFGTNNIYDIDFPYDSGFSNTFNNSFGETISAANGKIIFGSSFYNNQEGGIWMFDKDGNYERKIQVTPTPPALNNEQFSKSCAIYGNKVYASSYFNNPGGPGRGAVYIFNIDGSNQQKIFATAETQDYLYFGDQLVANQGTLAVGTYQNKVYVYKINEFYSDYVDEMSNNTHGYKTALTGTPGA